MDFDVIVVGAGGAGMMCASVAGQRGRRVLLLDHSTKLGEKIRISGGGRCNFTNLHTRPEAFLSRNPHFCRSALARYTARDFIALVERHGIRYHEKTLGQLFCDGSAVQIIAMLKHECDAAGVRWAAPAVVERVSSLAHREADAPGLLRHPFPFHETPLSVIPAPGGDPEPLRHRRAASKGAWIPASRGNDVGVQGPRAVSNPKQAARNDMDGPRFEVASSQGSFTTRSLVIATGGLSIPKTGATPFGYRIAEQFGVPVVPPKPALVPLAAAPEWLGQFGELSGTSFDAIASCEAAEGGGGRPAFRESALITHRGLSGPAVLQISSYWQLAGGRGPVVLDLMPERDAAAWLAAHRHDHQALGTLLEEFLPRRFAQSFATAHGWTQPLAQVSNATLETIAQTLKAWRIQPSGTLGYAKAEVTLGGVDTDALSQQTLEARAVPGLYFIGEVVDVTGWLGGYNFQWAWSSGYAAGMGV